MADKSELKDKKDALKALEDELVRDFLASAMVRHIMAPLEVEIAALEAKVSPKKSKAEDASS